MFNQLDEVSFVSLSLMGLHHVVMEYLAPQGQSMCKDYLSKIMSSYSCCSSRETTGAVELLTKPDSAHWCVVLQAS
jgi:hypothetical protein